MVKDTQGKCKEIRGKAQRLINRDIQDEQACAPKRFSVQAGLKTTQLTKK
jgi:hypothetical protein